MQDDRASHGSVNFLIGPGVQRRITERVHLDAASLFETNRDPRLQKFWFILGFAFRAGEPHHYAPRTGMRD